MAKSGDGERGLATRQQYQDPFSLLDSMFERLHEGGTLVLTAELPGIDPDDVEVEPSDGPGNGSEFTVRLPIDAGPR